MLLVDSTGASLGGDSECQVEQSERLSLSLKKEGDNDTASFAGHAGMHAD